MTEETKPQYPPDTTVTDEMVDRALMVQNLDLIQGFTYKTRHVIRDFRTDEGTELWSSPLGLGNHNAMMKRIEFIKMRAALESALTPTASGGDARNAALEEAAQYHDRAAADCRAIALVNLDNDLGADSKTHAIDHEIAAEDIREMKSVTRNTKRSNHDQTEKRS